MHLAFEEGKLESFPGLRKHVNPLILPPAGGENPRRRLAMEGLFAKGLASRHIPGFAKPASLS
jgi:hypothetical protein